MCCSLFHFSVQAVIGSAYWQLQTLVKMGILKATVIHLFLSLLLLQVVLSKSDESEANMLNLKSPVGVGFSYSTYKSCYDNLDDELTGLIDALSLGLVSTNSLLFNRSTLLLFRSIVFVATILDLLLHSFHFEYSVKYVITYIICNIVLVLLYS